MIIPQIISNPENQVRVDRLHGEMRRQGVVDYKLWPSVHIANKPRRTGISYAHKAIVEWASAEGLPSVLIMEDDVWFPDANGFNYYVENRPKEPFDLYLGGITRGEVKDGVTKRFTGAFCYEISEKFYSTFLGVSEDLDIDGAMSNLGTFYVCSPMACFTYWGWSENVRETVNLNHLLMGKELYGFGIVNSKDKVQEMTDLQNKHSGLNP
jgi:hypothetical protein